jgi:hypothetical protein
VRLRSAWLFRHGEPFRRRVLVMLPAAGLIFSVALAWACVLNASLTPVANGHLLPLTAPEQARLESLGWQPASPESGAYFNWALGFGSARCTVSEAWVWFNDRLDSGATLEDVAVRQRAGWPLHCLTAEASRPHAKGGPPTTWRSHGGIALGDGPARPPVLIPLKPMWPGLLFNSLLYGAILGLAAQAIRESIRYTRWRGRRCIACGYPAGTASACSECGAPLAHTASP